MQTEQLTNFLDSPEYASEWMRANHFRNPDASHRCFVELAETGFTIDLLSIIIRQLESIVDDLPDPDQTLALFTQFVKVSRSPIAVGGLFERDPTALPVLLKLFSISPLLSQMLIDDPSSYDLLRLTDGMPVSREPLLNIMKSEIENIRRRDDVVVCLRQFHRRETLRIAYGDLVKQVPLPQTMKQLALLADAVCAGAFQFALRELVGRRGQPTTKLGRPVTATMIAVGSFGGMENGYYERLSLKLLFSAPGRTEGVQTTISNQQFFDSLGNEIKGLLSDLFTVDIAEPIRGVEFIRNLELQGDMSRRLALIKARAIAGDPDFGYRILQSINASVYKSFLSFAEIAEIQSTEIALRRRLTAHDHETETQASQLSIRIGIHDVEFVIQFLQLMHGSESPSVRNGNTIEAIELLTRCECLTVEESSQLRDGYLMLRTIENLRQLTGNDPNEGITDQIAATYSRLKNEPNDAEALRSKVSVIIQHNRKILQHLLHLPIPSESEISGGDKVLDDSLIWRSTILLRGVLPNDDPEVRSAIEQMETELANYEFVDQSAAINHLRKLAGESNRFLSSHRCRHFFSGIAHSLLQEISQTPEPDQTLAILEQIADSIGGKAMLWELFNRHEAARHLFVRLCASGRYLARILIQNPGMIDELMNSLMLDRLPDRTTLHAELTELCQHAEAIDLIVHSFKNAHQLNIGIGDLMGKTDIREVHRSLADVADVCLLSIANHEERTLIAQYGEPINSAGERAELLMLAMGKLGAREPNYQSDLDVVFIFTDEGRTAGTEGRHQITNHQFFTRLCTRISRIVNQVSEKGRLYELDSRLRPQGDSGAPVVSIDAFQKFFARSDCSLNSLQSLCKARVINGSNASKTRLMNAVRTLISEVPWRPEFANDILQSRLDLEKTAADSNLKRGCGGAMDIECIVELLQLKHVANEPEILVSGTVEGLEQLHAAALLNRQTFQELSQSYLYLRYVDSCLKLLDEPRHELPNDECSLRHLAYLMQIDSPKDLVENCAVYRERNRRHLLKIAGK